MLSCTFSSFNIFVNENKKVVVQPKRLFQNKDDLVIKAENAVIKMWKTASFESREVSQKIQGKISIYFIVLHFNFTLSL